MSYHLWDQLGNGEEENCYPECHYCRKQYYWDEHTGWEPNCCCDDDELSDNGETDDESKE
jgi:hypothetical protein